MTNYIKKMDKTKKNLHFKDQEGNTFSYVIEIKDAEYGKVALQGI